MTTNWHRRLPVVQAYVIEGDFRWAMFLQALELRHAQLRMPARTPAQLRDAFNTLDAALALQHLPVPVPVLAGAGELVALDVAGLTARRAAHWMARFPPDTPGALRNAGMEGARWLHALSVGRSLLEREYPMLVPFVQQRLDDEIMRRYRIAFDSSCCYVVAFSGGVASGQAQSGWVHTRAQRQQVASFAECAMTAGQSQQPDYTPVPANGTHAGWLEIHGTPSSVLHIGDNRRCRHRSGSRRPIRWSTWPSGTRSRWCWPGRGLPTMACTTTWGGSTSARPGTPTRWRLIAHTAPGGCRTRSRATSTTSRCD